MVKYIKWFMCISVASMLIACGGSSDDSSDNSGNTTTATLSGTAATGAALANKTVTVVDSTGATVTTITDASGKYTVTVTAANKPFMLKVEVGAGSEPLYSFAQAGGGTVNITELTNLALHEANKNGASYTALSSLFTSFKDGHPQITETKLQNAKGLINATVASALSSNSVSNTFDVFSTVFNADGSGIDAVMDAVTIDIGSGGAATDITITIGGSAFTFDPSIDLTNFIPGSGSGGSGSSSLPSYVSGQIVNMIFGSAQGGSPYNNDEVVKFTFSSSGSLMLGDPSTLVSSTFTTNTAETLFTWDDGTYKYELSVLSNAIHEINVSSSSSGTFLGQFVADTSSSGLGTNGVSFTVNGSDLSYTSFSSQTVEYGATDVVSLLLDNGGATIKIPREIGTHNCVISVPGEILGTSVSAGACSIVVTSVSPLIATFSGKVQGSTFPFGDTELTNGSIYLDTVFVSSNSSSINQAEAFSITYGGVALNANTCNPSVLVTPTASTLLGGFNSDVYGWTGDVDEAGAFFEFSLNKVGNTKTPGQVNLRFVCSSLSVSWQVSGTLADLGISLDTSSGLVNFNNTVIPYSSTGVTTNDFPADTTVIPKSSLSITLNGTLAEI